VSSGSAHGFLKNKKDFAIGYSKEQDVFSTCPSWKTSKTQILQLVTTSYYIAIAENVSPPEFSASVFFPFRQVWD
jgi:hypothetical protein